MSHIIVFTEINTFTRPEGSTGCGRKENGVDRTVRLCQIRSAIPVLQITSLVVIFSLVQVPDFWYVKGGETAFALAVGGCELSYRRLARDSECVMDVVSSIRGEYIPLGTMPI